MASILAKTNILGTEANIASTAYCTCETAAATAAKVANLQGNSSNSFTLMTGITIHVKFTYSNTIANPTLNVNGTGAKAIMRYGSTTVSTNTKTSWRAGAVVAFTYDGTNWVMNTGIDDNDNTTYTAGTGLTLSNNTFNHSNSVTAGTASGSNGTLSHGGTFQIPSITYDACGHITGVSSTTCTLPSDSNTDTKVTNTLKSDTTKFYITGTTSNSTNTGTQVFNTSVHITNGALTATSFSGNGASLTNLNASNVSSGTLAKERLATSGVTAGSYGPSANASPVHGGTFSVPYVTVDTYGRVTSASTKTITMPSLPTLTASATSFTGGTTIGTVNLNGTPTTYKAPIWVDGDGKVWCEVDTVTA